MRAPAASPSLFVELTRLGRPEDPPPPVAWRLTPRVRRTVTARGEAVRPIGTSRRNTVRRLPPVAGSQRMKEPLAAPASPGQHVAAEATSRPRRPRVDRPTFNSEIALEPLRSPARPQPAREELEETMSAMLATRATGALPRTLGVGAALAAVLLAALVWSGWPSTAAAVGAVAAPAPRR